MKRIYTLLAMLLLVASAIAGFADYKTIVVGTLQAGAADTTLLGNWFFGYNRFALQIRGDTIVDTTSYVKIQFDLGGLGGHYTKTVGIGTAGDTVVLNSEGATKNVCDTLDAITAVGWWYGSFPLARVRVIDQQTAYAVKNCTLRLYRWKDGN
ncbi:hypothetical protein FJY70_01120 [candidate division WOR-3 bacterium]|nr:hypothetical protein [candidate division WOR-3 bacterium]MBM3314264.1 hypothetical protein [candidate division WOR-3 bacterium]